MVNEKADRRATDDATDEQPPETQQVASAQRLAAWLIRHRIWSVSRSSRAVGPTRAANADGSSTFARNLPQRTRALRAGRVSARAVQRAVVIIGGRFYGGWR
jgi:hypothetical protein